MLSDQVPVSYDIGAFVNVNVNVLPLVEQVRGVLSLIITSMSSEGNFTLIELDLWLTRSKASVPRSLSISGICPRSRGLPSRKQAKEVLAKAISKMPYADYRSVGHSE